jgi:ATP-binding cassette, subfamily B, multidrug efflux pump
MVVRSDAPKAYGFFIHHKNQSFMSLLTPHIGMLLAGSMLLLITNLIVAFLPLLINGGVSLIDTDKPFILSLAFEPIYFASIGTIIGAIIAAALMGAVLRTLSRMVLFDVGRIIERDLRAKLFFHVSLFDDSFFVTSSVGDVMNHLTTDINNIRMVVGFAILNIVNIVFVFCFTVPLLLKIDVTIACFALLPFPLIALVMSGVTRKMFHRTIEYQEQLSRMISHIQENLLGAQIIRLFHQQKRESERFLATNQKTYEAGVKLARMRILMMPIMRLLVGMAVGLVLYVGGQAVFLGRISLGDFVEMNARILQLAWPAMSVGFVMSVLSRGQASLQRVNNLLAYEPLIKDGKKTITALKKIDVHNLHLVPTAEAINFSLQAGQVLGIVGASGSYKTTLLRSLSRRRLIPDGAIFYDGHDINDLTMASIYEQVSVVQQENYLFNDTLVNNLRFARPDATDDEITEVLTLLRLDRDFKGFSNGINTVIGERGVTLSGGQRQRVALARALLKKRPVLILDDALSAVDKDTEHHIVSHLWSYLKGSMVIIATHRLSLCRHADTILVLDKGSIIERGKHEELISSSGLYRSLWDIDRLYGRSS